MVNFLILRKLTNDGQGNFITQQTLINRDCLPVVSLLCYWDHHFPLLIVVSAEFQKSDLYIFEMSMIAMTPIPIPTHCNISISS